MSEKPTPDREPRPQGLYVRVRLVPDTDEERELLERWREQAAAARGDAQPDDLEALEEDEPG